MTILTEKPAREASAENISQDQKTRITILRGYWTAFLDFVKKVCGFIPINPMGSVYIAALALTFYYIALGQDDIVWISASVALMIVGIIMILAVSVGAVWLAFSWKKACEIGLPDLNTSVGLQSRSGLELDFPPIPFVNVNIKWLRPAIAEVECRQGMTKITEYITPWKRSSSDTIYRQFKVEDILGLASITWTSEKPVKFKAYPHPCRINSSSITMSMAGGEDISDPYGSPQGDLIEMRQYVPGDSSRSILWKVYARNRRLVVRMPERALTAQTRTCAYLVSGANDEGSASFARAVLESRILGDNWLFGADGCSGTTSQIGEALDFLALSGCSESQPLCGLKNFLEEASKRGYHSCFVFVPASSGSWIKPALAAVRSTHLSITWLLGSNYNQYQTKKEGKWAKWIYTDAAVQNLKGPAEAAKALQSDKTPMILCELATGRIINNAAAYLQAQEKAV
ncbi:MAG: DUF58 domain-containing protein [Candidatus Bruticola sp.]